MKEGQISKPVPKRLKKAFNNQANALGVDSDLFVLRRLTTVRRCFHSPRIYPYP